MADEKTAPEKPGSTDARPYEESFWQRGQELYFKLLEMSSDKTRKDPGALSEARNFCREADVVLHKNLEDVDDFIHRVQVSETFYSESARVKKTEIFLKQLYFRKTRLEQLLRELGG